MSDMSEPKLMQEDLAAEGARGKPSRRRKVIAVVAALAAAAFGAAYIAAPKSHEATDDAYLQADETSVAPQVKGTIAEVLVRDNQKVKAGDALIRLDEQDLAARVRAAQAELQSAQANAQAAKAALVSHEAEERLSVSNMRAVETAIRSANAHLTRAVADQVRYERLAQTGAIAKRDVEVVRTAAIDAQAEVDRSTAALSVSRDQVTLTRTKRASLAAALAQAEASVARSEANLDLARQDQARASVRAPIDGVVGAIQVRVGDFVQPASRLMTLVPLEKLYVVAYFKETQMQRITPGQAASLEVDALPGQELRGVVDSIAPGTGSRFSLLPFEPGTGNFTKIVQRVPVRIRLDAGQEAVLAKLRPGLSVHTAVLMGK